MTRLRVVGLMLAALQAMGPMPARAHHSFAQFDMHKSVTITGTVKSVEWTNPHTWIWLVVTDASGTQKIWGLEGAAVGELTRKGWTRHSVVPGDKITADIHPLRDGREGGSFSRIVFADGRVLTTVSSAAAGSQ